MSELQRALGEISSIRRQLASSTQFRGYGTATLAATAAMAAAAGGIQNSWVPDPAHTPVRFLTVWIMTAVLGASLTAWSVYTRSRRMHSGLSDEMIGMAVQQFLPSVAAGALLTAVMVRVAPHLLWMLPGLWQVLYGLGVLSSCRFLPRSMMAAGTWYLLTGVGCIALGESLALTPWAMGLPFTAGQLLIACVLFSSHEEEPYDA